MDPDDDGIDLDISEEWDRMEEDYD